MNLCTWIAFMVENGYLCCLYCAIQLMRTPAIKNGSIFKKASDIVSRDSSVGRAFDCSCNSHQTVTGSIPVREIFVDFCLPCTGRALFECREVKDINHTLIGPMTSLDRMGPY